MFGDRLSWENHISSQHIQAVLSSLLGVYSSLCLFCQRDHITQDAVRILYRCAADMKMQVELEMDRRDSKDPGQKINWTPETVASANTGAQLHRLRRVQRSSIISQQAVRRRHQQPISTFSSQDNTWAGVLIHSNDSNICVFFQHRLNLNLKIHLTQFKPVLDHNNEPPVHYRAV